MTRGTIGVLAGVIAVLQVVPYMVSICRGDTKPERATYLIWFIVDVITLSSYIVVGARTTIWTGVAFAFTGALVFAVSIRRGVGGLIPFDVGCLLSVAAVLGVWAATRNASWALYLSLLVSRIGYLPTLRKAYLAPQTENLLSWAMAAFASVLNLFAVSSLAPQIAVAPVSAAATQLLIVGLLVFRRREHKRGRRRRGVNRLVGHPLLAR